jgi:hypothetical protein
MRFESRHNFFKKVSRNINCFKNIPVTLTKRGQLALANDFLNHSVFSNRIIIGTTKEELVGAIGLQDVKQFLCDKFSLSRADTVYIPQWIELGHYRIERNSVFVISVSDGIPEFVYVESMICFGDTPFLLVRKMSTLCCDSHFHGYLVNDIPATQLLSVQVSDLKDHIPLNIHTVFYEDKVCKYVSPRYVIY